MKLYDLQVMNTQLYDMLEKEEITQEDFEDNKQAIVELLQEKSESLIFINTEFETEINRLKEIEKLMADKRKSLENKQSKFKEFIMLNLEQLGIEEVKTPIGKIRIKTTVRTEVDEETLPNEAFDFIRKRKSIKEIEALGIKLNKIQNKTLEVK
jgi:ribosome-binding ATPase YchF (GTP1/OBG family)